ncbi:MAG: tRNA uridine(34) 5-carboxymethylaminomethyl modification radical SAM/GNAT enzyme Elp3 [Candidatus Nealsonbacteria bacterium]
MRNLDPLIKELVISGAKTPDDLGSQKRRLAKKYGIPCPSNIALLKTYHELIKRKSIEPSDLIEVILRTRPVRSLSGIVNVSVLTKPFGCPGKCLYCPNEKNIPKSYVSGEPAVERAKSLKYNPFLQVKKRIETLEEEGHPTDKIELRIVGETWSYYPQKYQTWFVKRCFDACNEKNSASLNLAQKINEKAQYRIIGLSIETRPDFITPAEIKRLRSLGATMVELGVQSTYDDVLKENERGHSIKETAEATQLLKDAGFKVLYQMMPNLLGSSPARDLKMFKILFSDERFQPDALKIYPCALLKNSPLFKVWQKGEYKPYAEKELISLIRSIKKEIPYYVRIQRITRDIPSLSIVAGPAKISNLRQLVSGNCKCIRCREVKGNYDCKEKIKFFRQNYKASCGKEIFLSFENKARTKLFSLLRLRISNNQSFIRELHTYGQAKTIKGSRTPFNSPQHRGIGRRLIEEAEKISKKESASGRIAVISGVGAREYYRKLGYRLENTYMVKNL